MQKEAPNGILGKMFGTLSEETRKDAKSTLIVVLIISNVFFISFWKTSQDANDELYERIITEVRPEISKKIKKEVDEQTEVLIEGIEKATDNLTELTNLIKEK